MDNIFKYTYVNKIDPSFSLNLSNLVTVYLPLLDSEAMALYLQLVNEKNFDSVFKTNQKDLVDLLKILSISLDQFETYRRKLEAFGLIRTYINYDELNQTKSYLFEIEHPLSFKEFISNNQYKKSFINKVGIEKFQELEFYYNEQINSSYKKVSENYDDVFEQFATNNEYVFDFEVLIKTISELAKASVVLEDDVKKLINFYFTSFSVTLKDIEKAVMNSISFVEDGLVVDYDLLELELSNSVTHKNNIFSSEIVDIKRVPNFFTKLQDDLVKKEIFIQYRNLTPESFLASLQKYQIGDLELNLINRLRKDFHLTNEIINIVLDYSVMKTHGKVNELYIEKVVKSLNLVGIKTLPEAYNYFYYVSTNVKKKTQKKDDELLQFIELFN